MAGLAEVVQGHLGALRGISEAQASHKSAAEVWSAKEILGHLLDSGVNNHARFVRVSLDSGLSLPGYDQTAWVQAGAYATRPWAELVELWAAYQTQLAHLIAALPPASLDHTVQIGSGEPVTLRFLTEDYVAHQLHHLAQIPGRVGP
ncbi:DinB family protein [Deinococcus multiflagellatus]|uniref:DinB family protein n=1 Tax=Deinococcus multiflagellatus TaxID=1656887 RepID=A0ABW1ZLI8_9DEIO|nr:DinB family protein [Deinococcus multiflagellatus]MBZ9713399.1 DinB family protein [Deinococcus multiflagellatus]